MKNNFSRSNVNEKTLNVTMPDMSSFDLSHSCTVTPQLGKIVPVNIEPLLVRDVVSGNLSANLSLEKILTPSIGRVRLDTHTFFVSEHRINRDAKQFYEGMSGFTSKPKFSMQSLCAFILGSIVGEVFEDIPVLTPSEGFGTLGDIDFAEDAPTGYTSWQQYICDCILSQIMTNMQALIGDGDTIGYNLDFLQQEWKRLAKISAKSMTSYARLVYEIMSPYIGEGSLFDHLGYYIYTPYTRTYADIEQALSQNESDIMNIGYNFAKVLWDYENDTRTTLPDRYYDESPLRVYYAIWYDYFRNFHVEKRANVLDPDLFGKDSLISSCISSVDFKQLLNLIVYRTRNFSRDYLTTIQTEDAFRYVYNPILTGDFGSGAVNAKSPDDEDATLSQFYNSIETIFLNTSMGGYDEVIQKGFPVGQSAPEIATLSTFKSDLQTMRRAGMLEKLLAREYYYPDTYAGKMLAHYGVQPGDMDMLNSVYLAGSEQFINGEQQIANVGTEYTPQGTRTMVGGVNTKDSFAYSATNPGWIMSVVSLVPMVSYDAPNMHLFETEQHDIPLPQFASDTRVCVAAKDVLRGMDEQNIPIGYVPRYYAWRVHPDETHGKYLTDYRAYKWLRDWYDMNFGLIQSATQGDPVNRNFTLSPYSLRVALPLNAFLGLNSWDSIAFGEVDLNFFVTRALPAAVETI